jgi:hypothetical protein
MEASDWLEWAAFASNLALDLIETLVLWRDGWC